MKPLQTAIDHMGNASRLARAIGVTTQAVCFWRTGARQIPAERCPAIEEATGGLVTCEELRPDVRWDVLRRNSTPALANTAHAAAENIAQGVAHV